LIWPAGSLAQMQASFRSNEGRIGPRLPYSNIRFMDETLPAGSVALSGRGAFLIGALHCGTFTNKIDPGSGY